MGQVACKQADDPGASSETDLPRTDPSARAARSEVRRLGTASGYALSLASVVATTAIGWVARTWIGVPDVEMLYLLAVVISAARWGRGPSIASAALSVVAYDVFFVPPHFTLAVADARYLLTFAVMFGAGYVVSRLTHQVRRREQGAKAREERTAALAWEAKQAAVVAKTEQLRSSLLSSVSHDLRTPLAAITGAATTLRHEVLSAGAREELAETICEEAERLERQLSNLLDMTRLDSGAVVARKEWVPLEEIVGGALTRLEARLGARKVDTSLAEDLPMVPVDPVLMQQLFVNLFENASKYTPSDTVIEVSAVREGSKAVVVEVSDHGVGLPAGEEEAVFERFHRGPHGEVPGAGLGLSICRAIAQAHGGSLTAHNLARGGACFRLLIPVEGAPPEMLPDEPDEEGP